MRKSSLVSFALLIPTLAFSMPPSVHQEILATVGEDRISSQEMKEALKQQLYDIESQRYETEKGWIEERVENILLDQEARRSRLSREKLEEREIKNKTAKASEAELRKFYEENKARFKKDEAQKDPDSYDTVKEKIATHLNSQKAAKRHGEYLAELRKKTPVTIALIKPEPPKIPVTYGPESPVLGNPKAPVTILEFTDMQCPYCVRAQDTLKEVLKKYPDQVKIVCRSFPLAFHPRARPLAIASLCAQDQGKYEVYRSKVFGEAQLDDKALAEEAGKLGMDKAVFEKCFASKKYDAQIDKDILEGGKWGVSGTPAFFVNGYFLSGAQPLEAFDELIQKALKEAK